MNLIEQLLKITYSREVELENKLESEYTKNKWFVEDTKSVNVALQIKCLEEIDRAKKKIKYYSGLH